MEEKQLQGWKDLKEQRLKLQSTLSGIEENVNSNTGSTSVEKDAMNFTGGRDYLEKAWKSLKGFEQVKNSEALKEEGNEKLDVEINHPSSPQELKGDRSPALGPGSFSNVDGQQRAADLSLDPSGGKVLERELKEKVGAGSVEQVKR